MDSYIKLVSKTFFINDVFEADEYFSIYSQKKIMLLLLITKTYTYIYIASITFLGGFLTNEI